MPPFHLFPSWSPLQNDLGKKWGRQIAKGHRRVSGEESCYLESWAAAEELLRLELGEVFPGAQPVVQAETCTCRRRGRWKQLLPRQVGKVLYPASLSTLHPLGSPPPQPNRSCPGRRSMGLALGLQGFRVGREGGQEDWHSHGRPQTTHTPSWAQGFYTGFPISTDRVPWKYCL